jgi:hypothetical protein
MFGRVVLIVFMCGVLFGSALPAAAQDDGSSDSGISSPGELTGTTENYDLASLIVFPADFNDAGYGTNFGLYSTLESDAASINAGNDGSDKDLAAVQAALEGAGWQQSYYAKSGIPNADDTTHYAVYVYQTVMRFKDDDGAAAGYELVHTSNTSLGYVRVGNIDTVGDASTLSQLSSTLKDGTESNSLDLLIQSGPFVVEILIFTYTGEKPDQDATLVLGEVSVKRIAKAKPGVGLSQRVLKLTGDGVTSKDNSYTRLNGDQIAYYGEASKTVKSDDAFWDDAGVTSIFFWRQNAPSTSGGDTDYLDLTANMYQLESADQAEALSKQFNDTFTESPPAAYTDVKDAAGAKSFGDDSATVSYHYDRGDGTDPVAGYRIAVLADDMIVIIYAESGGDLSLKAIEAVAGKAVTCAGKATVCKAMALPSALAA